MHFANKNIIITGGTSGIGLRLSCQLFAAGANLMVLSRSAEHVSAAVEEIELGRKSAKQQLIMKNFDLSQRYVDHVIEKDISAFNVDVLINNAGIVTAKTFQDQSLEEVYQQIDTNLVGSIYLTKMCLPILLTKDSQIVFINSLAGLIALYGYTGYSASKFGAEGFARSLTQELIGTSVHVCTVYPPDTDTPQLAAELKSRPEKLRRLNTSPPIQPDFVARCVIEGMKKRKTKVFPGMMAKVHGYLFLYLSEVVYKYFHRVLA